LAFQTKFNKELDRLYRRRTDELRRLLSRGKPGLPKGLTKRKRERAIRKLKESASRCLAPKMWNRERKEYEVVRKQWPVLGWGPKQKRANFRQWLKDEVPDRHGIKVYAFLRGKECRYVGVPNGLATISVSSNPDGGDIYADDSFIGSAPPL
jgi:hypothetical protein